MMFYSFKRLNGIRMPLTAYFPQILLEFVIGYILNFFWCQPLTVIVSSIIDWYSNKALATSLVPSSTFSFLMTWFLWVSISSLSLNLSLLMSPARLPTNDRTPTNSKNRHAKFPFLIHLLFIGLVRYMFNLSLKLTF